MRKLFILLLELRKKIVAFFEKYLKSYGEATQKAYKSNAFAPLVWLDVFIVPLLILVVIIIKVPAIQMIFVILIITILLFSILMYYLIFKRDPSLLQSEEFRIENRKLDIIESKGSAIQINPVDILPPKQLNAGGEDG